MLRLVFIAFLAVHLFGCRFGQVSDRDRDPVGRQVAKAEMPAQAPRVTNRGGAPSIEWGVAKVDHIGTVKARLVLGLEYFPPSRPNIASLPRCLDPLPDDFRLGRAQCLGKDLAVDLLVRHVSQQCAAGVDKISVLAAEQLTMPGCNSVNFVGFVFDPPLQLKIEVLP